MLYAIMAVDVPNSLASRQAVRPEHLKRLEQLQAQGRLILAGPHPLSDAPSLGGFSGSLIVAEFAALTDAQAWAEQDPYQLAGVYESVNVKPFMQVFPQ